MDNNSNSLNHIQESLRKTIGESANVSKMGKGYKIKIGDSKITYRVKSDGTVYKYEEMDPTPVYARLDDDGTLYLRATQLDKYKPYTGSDSIQPNWNTSGDATTTSVVTVMIEEPIAPSSLYRMFSGFNNLTLIKNVKNLHTENVTSMVQMFENCNNLSEIDISNFDTSKTTSFENLFYGCNSIENLNFENFDTTEVQSFSQMFSHCFKLTNLDLNCFNTKNVKSTGGMFQYCGNLVSIKLNNFNLENVLNTNKMFFCCSKLIDLELGNVAVSKVNNISNMFDGCSSLQKVNLSGFNTSLVTSFNQLFYNCNNLKYVNLGNTFEINSNSNTNSMFRYFSNIKIRTTRNTSNILKSKFPDFTDDNFEIIE